MFSHLNTFFTHKKSLAVGSVFISMGFLYGNWATIIPFVKEKFQLNDAQLGLLLLSMPFGSTVANPIATILINRFGMRQTTITGMILMATCYAMPVNSNILWITSIALILIGCSIAITNVAMNTCVTSIEHDYKIKIMSTCHGMFSVGLMTGSFLSSLMLGFEIHPSNFMIGMSLLIVFLALIIRPIIMKIHEEKIDKEIGSKFVLPRGALSLMILISLCTNITEGAMADWTAVYMKEVVNTTSYFIGWGLAGYSMFMALGRFMGDSLIPKYGANRTLKFGGLLTSLGILISVTLPFTFTSIIGFALVGAGVSCGAPILYGSAARIPNMAKGAGLATMNSFSIAGFLVGPAFIGFLSENINLPFAISFVGILGLLWASLVNNVKLY